MRNNCQYEESAFILKFPTFLGISYVDIYSPIYEGFDCNHLNGKYPAFIVRYSLINFDIQSQTEKGGNIGN